MTSLDPAGLEAAATEAKRLASLSPAGAEAEREGTEDHANWVARKIVAAYLSVQEQRSQTVWTCMSCGHITESQSCDACGREAMPGRWVQEQPDEREALRGGSGGSHIALPEGELIGPGDGPLGHADDQRRWEPGGPRIYAASSYVVIIQWGVERGTVPVDPGRRYWEPFIAALEAARAYANRRSPRSPWPTKGETR